jgi:hypothetical protein
MAYLQLLASFNRKMGFVSLQRSKGAVAIEDMFRKFHVVLDRVVARVHKYARKGRRKGRGELGEKGGRREKETKEREENSCNGCREI